MYPVDYRAFRFLDRAGYIFIFLSCIWKSHEWAELFFLLCQILIWQKIPYSNVKKFSHWPWIFFAIWLAPGRSYLLALTKARWYQNGKSFLKQNCKINCHSNMTNFAISTFDRVKNLGLVATTLYSRNVLLFLSVLEILQSTCQDCEYYVDITKYSQSYTS